MANSDVISSRFAFALLLLRVAVAVVFLYHGSAILFGAFGGPGPVAFAGLMHAPVIIGYLVGLAQFAGGIAVLTGIFYRLGAVCLMIVMLGAMFLVHLPHGFNVAKGGYEFAMTEFFMVFALLLTGPGPWSLNCWLPPSLRGL